MHTNRHCIVKAEQVLCSFPPIDMQTVITYIFFLRISDKSTALHGCLADNAGEPLLHDLETGAELCYRALPSYEQKARGARSDLTTKAIPVIYESKLAYL